MEEDEPAPKGDRTPSSSRQAVRLASFCCRLSGLGMLTASLKSDFFWSVCKDMLGSSDLVLDKCICCIYWY